MPDNEKSVRSLQERAEIGLMDAVKKIGEYAQEKGISLVQAAKIIDKAYTIKIKPELEKQHALQHGKAAEQEATQKITPTKPGPT